ncbi:MAG: HEAT repeat domain-containing protein [Candidatus Micrarchaeota archaeon]
MAPRLWKSVAVLSCAATCSFRVDAAAEPSFPARPPIAAPARRGEMHSGYLRKLYDEVDRRRETARMGFDEDAEIRRFRETLLDIRGRGEEFDEGVFGNPLADSLERSVRALAMEGGGRSIQSLAESLQNPQDEIRRASAWAVGAILERHKREGRELPEFPEAIRRLREASRDESWTVRAAAAQSLLQGTGNPDYIGPLLRDGHREARAAADNALRRWFRQAGTRGTLGSLESGVPAVREAAARSLEEHGDASAVPALLDALDDRDRGVRKAANDAIRAISIRRGAGGVSR